MESEAHTAGSGKPDASGRRGGGAHRAVAASTWPSKRIAALDKDLGRTLDSEHKLMLQERRRDLVAEREQVAKEMAQIEQQLGS